MKYLMRASLIALTLVSGSPAMLASIEARQAAAADSEMLGTVTLKQDVMADGKPLKAGTYRLRLTGDQATPPVAGQTADLERWVEFLRGGKVVGREVVSIVPKSEIRDVAQDEPPRAGAAKVQMLKGNEYVRVWVNKGGNHYLIHLPTGQNAGE